MKNFVKKVNQKVGKTLAQIVYPVIYQLTKKDFKGQSK